MSSPGFEESLWLVFNRVPFDLAFSLDEDHRTAMAIKFSEFRGAKFDTDSFTFQDQK